MYVQIFYIRAEYVEQIRLLSFGKTIDIKEN